MSLWLPNTMNYEAYRVDRAVREYDERLMFARNEQTGDWCVFIKMPKGEQPYPVLGFQDTIPEPHQAMERLMAADCMRHGNKIYDDVMRSQQKVKDDARKVADEARDESVEHIEFMMRQHGKSPIIKSFSKEVSADGD